MMKDVVKVQMELEVEGNEIEVSFGVAIQKRIDEDLTKKEREEIERLSVEISKIVSKAVKRRISEGKPIAQYTIDGKYIRTFYAARQVKRELGIHNASACARGECKTSGGFVWKYV